MSSPSLPSLTPELFLLVVLILIIARRTVRQIQGARFSTGRMFAFAAIYVLLFVALAFATLYAAVVTWGSNADLLLAPYVAVPLVGAYFAAPYVRRVVRFERRANGARYYRLSWHVPVLFLALFTARLIAEVAVFGLAGVVVSFPPPPPPSVVALEVLIGVDLLFALSLGLMVGRGIGVVLAHRDLPPQPTVPPPSPPLPSG
ncbi:MAG TPA: hypothetical protein VEG66_05725 [Thermoplasmata archaeon]|nr:hypothetical protein [Thermoplasmata archaeon]